MPPKCYPLSRVPRALAHDPYPYSLTPALAHDPYPYSLTPALSHDPDPYSLTPNFQSPTAEPFSLPLLPHPYPAGPIAILRPTLVLYPPTLWAPHPYVPRSSQTPRTAGEEGEAQLGLMRLRGVNLAPGCVTV